MRVVHAAALTAAAILLASITSAQGIGAAAAREKERRNTAPAKPVKVYTDNEVASSPTSTAPEVQPAAGETTTAAQGGAGTQASSAAGSAEPQTDEEKAKAAEAKAEAAAAEAQAKAQTEWRGRLDAERQEESRCTELIGKLNAELGNLAGMSYSAARAQNLSLLEETKQKLAQAQANIARLQDEGRRNGYR